MEQEDAIILRVAATSVAEDGLVADSRDLVADLPMLARAIQPLAAASHVLVMNVPSVEVPLAVQPYLGAYAPSAQAHDGIRTWERVGQKPAHVVADSHF